jgi:hypothetical protein
MLVMVPLVFKILKSCERCWGGWIADTSFTKETCSATMGKWRMNEANNGKKINK